MKRRIFLVCLFTVFFRLPFYESIAAIFWQSASYVLLFKNEGIHLQIYLSLSIFVYQFTVSKNKFANHNPVTKFLN